MEVGMVSDMVLVRDGGGLEWRWSWSWSELELDGMDGMGMGMLVHWVHLLV